MFTGLVEELGTCRSLERSGAGARLVIDCIKVADSLAPGDSVAVNGCCLTVTNCTDGTVAFDLLGETLDRTNLGGLLPGDEMNLERALPVNGRLGGHYVQGHIDFFAPLLSELKQGEDLRLEFGLPPEFARFVAFKGSIAINGVSLTVAEVLADRFSVWIIPHTQSATTLGTLTSGQLVNIECDILAKYTERILQARHSG